MKNVKVFIHSSNNNSSNKTACHNCTKTRAFMVAVFIFALFFLSACNNLQNANNVNMTPRLISATSNLTAEEVVENVQPAVVGITSHSNSASNVGSGVAIADGGYILTNYHVIENARTIVVHLANQTQNLAQLVWSDPSLDLAIIKSKTNLPHLQLGTSKNLKVGQDIIAIGTPIALQFKHTVTKGIVSALNRTLEVGGVSDVTYLQNLIQHDASINPGNSGGPLISLDCKLVGINTLKANQAEGIGFAIPIEIASAISKRVINNSAYVPAYIGLFGLDSQIAAFYNQTKQLDGVYVLSIDQNSPAQQAGVQEGDVVVQIQGQPIKTVLDLRVMLYQIDSGETVNIKVLRGSQQVFLQVKAQKKG